MQWFANFSTGFAITILVLVVLMMIFQGPIVGGRSDGEVDAKFRDDPWLGEDTFQRSQPAGKGIRFKLYLFFYKRGWQHQLRQEKVAEERIKKGDAPLMPRKNGSNLPGSWLENEVGRED